MRRLAKMTDKSCSSCMLCMPNKEDMVCAGKHYGKTMSEKELETFVCEEYEPYPDFLTEPDEK